MRPKDIVIGQKYKHSDYPNVEYLGVGMAKNKLKFLLIVGENTLVVSPENYRMAGGTKKELNEWWSRFSPIK